MSTSRFKYIIIGIVLLLPLGVFAQEKREDNQKKNKKEIGVSVGGNFGYFKDDLFSALNYNKAGVSSEISYTVGYTKRKTILDVKVMFEQGKLSYPGVSEFNADYWNATIQVDFMKQLFEKQGHSLYVGGRYRSFGQRAYLNENGGTSAYSYIVNHGLHFNTMYNFSRGKHNLSSMVSVSLLGYTTHTPDNWWDDYTYDSSPNVATYMFDGSFTLPNEFLNVEWRSTYSYQLSKSVSLGASYWLKYDRLEQRFSYSELNNNISINVKIKL